METSQVFLWLLKYKYLIMFPLAVVEGPILSVISGFLIHLGQLTFLPTYAILMAGDLVGDTVWYLIGRYGARPLVDRAGHMVGITPARLAAVEKLFHRHKSKTLLISKMTTGFGLAPIVLMTAGSTRIPFGIFIVLNALGQLFWSGLLILVGAFFGQFYGQIDAGLQKFYVIAVAILFGLGLYFLQKHLRSTLTKKQS